MSEIFNSIPNPVKSHFSIFSHALSCIRCNGNGVNPVCGTESFHIFADDPAVIPSAACNSTLTSDIATHVINLDAPPEERWAHIIPLYADAMRALLPVIKREMLHKAEGFSEAVADLFTSLPEHFDFVHELAGISKLTGIDVTLLLAGNLWLETGGMGCSTLLADVDTETINGEAGLVAPYIIRTMDWQIPEFRIGTIQLKFVRGGRIIFVATTHTGCIGMITACCPGFGVSVNHRREDDVHGDKIKRRQAQLTRVLNATSQRLSPVCIEVILIIIIIIYLFFYYFL